MAILGKLHDTRSLSSSIARATDLTKMTTYYSDIQPCSIRTGRGTHLIEVKGVQKLVQLPVLANLLQLHVVLLETVKRELRLVIDEDLERLGDCVRHYC